jgi:hypothetical protein
MARLIGGDADVIQHFAIKLIQCVALAAQRGPTQEGGAQGTAARSAGARLYQKHDALLMVLDFHQVW